MTALLLTEIFPPIHGGSARWFWELYRRMPHAEVAIAAGHCPGDADFDRSHDLRITRLSFARLEEGVVSASGWLGYRRAARTLRAVIDREAVDRLHCGRLLPEGWLAWRSGLPFGCYVHGEELSSMRTSRQLTWMAQRVLSRAALLIANSEHSAAMLRARWGAPPARIVVLPPPVDTARFAPAAPDDAARAALGWCRRQVVLTVARLQKRKGHDRMIDAVGLLRGRIPALLYAVVGDGEERAALTEQVRRSGLGEHVRFYGTLPDPELIRAYQQCDLFALANRTVDGDFEGFGMVLIEAQACARAVLAGDSGGTVEAVRAGETGVIVDCTRAEPIAAAVESLLGDAARRQRMGAAGRRWTEQAFDGDVLVARAADLLERIR